MADTASLAFNPNIAAAPNYVGGTAIETVQEKYNLEDVIKLASNESMLPPSPQAIEAIQEAVTNLNRYPGMLGDDELRASLAGAIGQGMMADNFVTGNGGCDVLALIATSFLNQRDECIICRPTFPVYDLTARRRGADVVYVDLDPDHFTYDIEKILGAVNERTRIVYICTPNNPTGTILNAAQMETLIDNLPDHVVLVSDEVYHHFATADDFPKTLDYVRQGKNVIIIHSLSKVFSLAGLRLGYAIAPEKVATYVSRARQPYHLSKLTMVGATAALQDKAHLAKTIDLTISGRDWLYAQLQEFDLQLWPSQANFITFKPPYDADLICQRLEQQGVIIRPLTGFYLPNYLRVTIGLPEENERLVKTLQDVLAQLEAEGAPKNH